MPTELLATCWTHAGDALPVPGRHLSPLDLRVRAEAVSAAGFTGIGFTIDDLEAARATYGVADVRRICDDLGLAHREVELLEDWWTSGARREGSDRKRRALLRAAETLGSHGRRPPGRRPGRGHLAPGARTRVLCVPEPSTSRASSPHCSRSASPDDGVSRSSPTTTANVPSMTPSSTRTARPWRCSERLKDDGCRRVRTWARRGSVPHVRHRHRGRRARGGLLERPAVPG